MPARRSAAAVPAPTAHQRCPRLRFSACSAFAARAAAGLVAITMSAASAACSARRVAASACVSIRHGDNASTCAPRAAAARRKGACAPTGRSEIT
ncbi:MAG: hypothetical protein U1F20_00580 [Lysobacterales bacterium]